MVPSFEIKAYVIISLVAFVLCVIVFAALHLSLLIKKVLLRRAQDELERQNASLEDTISIRTAKLRASEAKYKELFEKSSDAIFIVDPRSRKILDTNLYAETLTGCSEEELQDSIITDLFATHLDPHNPDCRNEYICIAQNGDQKIVDVGCSDISIDGNLVHQLVCRDITKRRELEAQLIQTSKIADLGLFAAGVGHEIRTPMSTMVNSIYYMKEFLPKAPDEWYKQLDIIREQVSRCVKIIDELLTFTRKPSSSLDLKLIDINDLIEKCLSLTNKEIISNGITLVKDFNDLADSLLDSDRFNQVLTNLLTNAIQAMPSGGDLTIKTWCDTDAQGLKDMGASNEVIHISFSDSGHGISKENKLKLFTPLFTTKTDEGGIGLGLYVTYGIVKSFNGDISVESKPGEGSIFTIHLPVQT